MKSRILFLFRYFTFWIIVFLVQKVFFLFYNYKESFQVAAGDWFMILYKGLPLDFSTSAYICLFPALLIAFKFFGKNWILPIVLNIYTYIILFIVLLLGVIDMNLYSYWGFKLDISPLIYIKTPGEVLASVEITEIAILLVLFVLLYYLFLKFYHFFSNPDTISNQDSWWKILIVGLFLAGLLVIPARGGFGLAPMNLSRVYFHKNMFVNHSAINVSWNTIYSITKRDKLETRHDYMDDAAAEKYFSGIVDYTPSNPEPIIKDESNVLIIVLESFSNKIIASLGGEDGVTPGLDSLFNHSVVFTNFYASGDRSDKGLVSIFSGFPAQPTTSIIDYPHKFQSLPLIYSEFADSGYSTAFYYGGNLNFANFRAYFSNTWMDKLVTELDFPKNLHKQKWGVPDEFLFDRLLEDLSKEKKPFFYSCFTLSSHEPYDVKTDTPFGISDRDALSRNAFHYTDKMLGVFLNKAKSTSWWDRTLIIIVGDHGSRSPGNTAHYVDEKFKIPMFWTGGAVLKDTLINKTGSQVDIPATLLGQFHLDHSKYKYSRNLLDPNSPPFAFYAFNNGFGVKDSVNSLIYDLSYNKTLFSNSKDSTNQLNKGKAYLQIMSNDFIERK